MRLFIPTATILTLALFLGGCWHVHEQPPAPQPATTTDKTIEEVREAVQLGDIKKRLLAGEEVAGLKYDPALDKDWKQYEFHEVGLKFKLPAYYIITTSTGMWDEDPLVVSIIEDINNPKSPGRVTDYVIFLFVRKNTSGAKTLREVSIYKERVRRDYFIDRFVYEGIHEFKFDNLDGQLLVDEDAIKLWGGNSYSLDIIGKRYIYPIGVIRQDELGNFIVNLKINDPF